jgi:hypothetical protein
VTGPGMTRRWSRRPLPRPDSDSESGLCQSLAESAMAMALMRTDSESESPPRPRPLERARGPGTAQGPEDALAPNRLVARAESDLARAWPSSVGLLCRYIAGRGSLHGRQRPSWQRQPPCLTPARVGRDTGLTLASTRREE